MLFSSAIFFIVSVILQNASADPQPLNISRWKRVLMIAAHPDDIEASAGT
jgi:hypothetical protein